MLHTSFQQHIDQLEQLLDHPALEEDGLTGLECLGLLTANAIIPSIEEQAVCQVVIGESTLPESFPRDELTSALNKLTEQIQRQLYLAEPPLLPLQFTEEEQWLEAAEAWSIGFMTTVFEAEALWFNKDHQEVSELLLPIMVLSGLFSDQPEFVEMREDSELVEDMFNQLADVVTELYLIFQAPEEKPKFHKSKKK
ncbi:YecA family protein [Endozoicomonas sp. SM1973]|uniref:YecA family protein n=1 Tax=Spartinivicinus marinus TaxID=2994442 RepID=A0A853HSE0_9GAMM|nr:YecA family protein [Spartinivicinus marinus]MCX4030045.1 YecA family protein [Spartinivicinus marinus]NYZ64710.1 YecA family protein [Spartinivicinus marinus]